MKIWECIAFFNDLYMSVSQERAHSIEMELAPHSMIRLQATLKRYLPASRLTE